MLQKIRDTTQGAISKIIIYPLIVIFAMWGLDAIVGNFTNPARSIKVNGTEITDQQIETLVQQKAQEYLTSLGPDADLSNYNDSQFREAAVNELIQRALLANLAEDTGMVISSAAVDRRIAANPDFQIDGKFNAERANLLLQSGGYTAAAYRGLLAQELLLNQQLTTYSATGFATKGDIERIAALAHQKRNFRYVTIALASVGQELTISDDDIAAYFAANQSAFMREEQVKLSYIELNKEALLTEISVDEADVRKAYDDEVATYKAQTERRASHILFEASDDAGFTAAEAEAKAAKARLDAGEDFATVAKELSDDTGSAQDGGDVGYTTGDTFAPEFETALQGLELNQVSEPVRTSFGYHLIKLTEIAATEPPPFEERRAEIERNLKMAKADTLFLQRSEELSNLAFESLDLAEPATQMGLQVQTTEWFGRSGGAGITANANVISAAFKAEQLEERLNSEMIQVDANRSVVIHVDDHQLPELRPLEEVRGEIEALLHDQRQREQVRTLGEGFVKSLQDGENIDALLQVQGQSWTQVDAVERNAQNVNPEVLNAVFSAASPAAGATLASGTQLANGDFVVFELQSVTPGTDADFREGEAASLRNFINQQTAANDFVGFMLSLEGRAKVKGKENYLTTAPAEEDFSDESL
jgi:peptidyl-prolyl cis-trans isomerase D